jgi:DNA-binding NarL/FixJ family response regulator
MSDDTQSAVFLLAQNRLLREALSRILSNKNDINVVGSCALSSDALQEIVAASPDVLVIDSFSSNHADLDFVREVQQSLPDLRLVLIGMESDGQHLLQAIRGGAMGYIVKDASALEVVAAIRTVTLGGAA